MSDVTCILSTKDFTILEVMRDRLHGRDDPLAPILERKIQSALVMSGDVLPADVATLNSRVTFRVNEREPDTRIISQQRVSAPVGMSVPITTLRGLALLGLGEGQAFHLQNGDTGERIFLEKVQYQPEAARRDREVSERRGGPSQGRPMLRLVGGTSLPDMTPRSADHDDPGPSAA